MREMKHNCLIRHVKKDLTRDKRFNSEFPGKNKATQTKFKIVYQNLQKMRFSMSVKPLIICFVGQQKNPVDVFECCNSKQ